MTSIPLGGGAEFDRIRAISARLGSRAGPLGDDCAFIVAAGETLAVSTDVSVEGVHFRREWLSPAEIGWRAAAAALSDLAAAGASVVGLLAALTLPRGADPGLVVELMDGVGDAVASAGGRVLGGDLSSGEAMALAITVIGRADHPAHRRGARPGDGLWGTGSLGGARAALAAWQAGREPAPRARERFARPVPRIREGAWLAAHGATAMLDLSDGLAGDARHLAAASEVAVVIDLAAVPVDSGVTAEVLGDESAQVFAARGGEDYELLVAMPPAFRGAEGLDLTRVGSVAAGGGARFQLDSGEVVLSGYDHFA